MTNFAHPESVASPVWTNVIYIRIAAAIALAALADWLFYEEYAGISVVLFAIALAGASLFTNRAVIDRQRLLPAALVLIAGLLPAIEDLNALSLAFVLL